MCQRESCKVAASNKYATRRNGDVDSVVGFAVESFRPRQLLTSKGPHQGCGPELARGRPVLEPRGVSQLGSPADLPHVQRTMTKPSGHSYDPEFAAQPLSKSWVVNDQKQ